MIFCFVLPKSCPGEMIKGDFLGPIMTEHICLQGFGAFGTLSELPAGSCVHSASSSKKYTLGAGQEPGACWCQRGDWAKAGDCQEMERLPIAGWGCCGDRMAIQTIGAKSVHVNQKTPHSSSSLSPCLQDIFRSTDLIIAPSCHYSRKAPCHTPKITRRCGNMANRPFPVMES